MKLHPKYSYEFNCVLNDQFTENQQIQNFASLISDKERFLALLPLIKPNEELIEQHLGYSLPDEVIFYVVRAEKFKSFSEPITIEYSILPEEMLLFLLKEIIKTAINTRFPDEKTQEEYLNSFIDFIIINGEWDQVKLIKFTKNLHDNGYELFEGYQYQEIDFKQKTMKEHIEEMFSEE
jgi:hypothetical protein